MWGICVVAEGDGKEFRVVTFLLPALWAQPHWEPQVTTEYRSSPSVLLVTGRVFFWEHII